MRFTRVHSSPGCRIAPSAGKIRGRPALRLPQRLFPEITLIAVFHTTIRYHFLQGSEAYLLF